jgi:hypothetical protein
VGHRHDGDPGEALLGYIDAIFIFSLICAVMAPTAFLMQKPQKGAKPRSGH